MIVEWELGVEAEETWLVESAVFCLRKEGVGLTGLPFDNGVPGDSKSQDTPCFEQLPHVGCTSSHYAGISRIDKGATRARP
jgi:hypothetical protein